MFYKLYSLVAPATFFLTNMLIVATLGYSEHNSGGGCGQQI